MMGCVPIMSQNVKFDNISMTSQQQQQKYKRSESDFALLNLALRSECTLEEKIKNQPNK